MCIGSHSSSVFIWKCSVRYDTYVRYVHPKVSLIYRTEPISKKSNGIKNERHKTEMLRRNGPVINSVEPILRSGRESMVGKICERGRSWAGSEREKKLWNGESGKLTANWASRGKSETEGLERGWRKELGGWFQRQGQAYRKERSVIAYVTRMMLVVERGKLVVPFNYPVKCSSTKKHEFNTKIIKRWNLLN